MTNCLKQFLPCEFDLHALSVAVVRVVLVDSIGAMDLTEVDKH